MKKLKNKNYNIAYSILFFFYSNFNSPKITLNYYTNDPSHDINFFNNFLICPRNKKFTKLNS